MIGTAVGIVVLLAVVGLLAWTVTRDGTSVWPRLPRHPRHPRRARRWPRELRGDWWPDFERQFREYERRARPRTDRPRDPHDRRPPPR